MTSSHAHGTQNGSANGYHTYTVTALGRWSVLDKQLPAVDKIKAIHVYDFDNTLFKTPLPNRKLWSGPTIGALANPDIFVNGGWWHDSRILAATGEGLEKEEPRGWEGWWNEKIVELVELSNQQDDALCVLLTGRSEAGFGDLIKRMVQSKNLEFDMISLKPSVGPNHEKFENTMHFKQVFLGCLMDTYKLAEEIRIYEDRPKHVKGFRDFLADYNRRQNGLAGRPTRSPLSAEVIQVADVATTLDPVVEVAEVQQLVNRHNDAVQKGARGEGRADRLVIKKTVFYTGYLIGSADTQRLLALAPIPPAMRDAELRFHANNIMICPRPPPQSILDKVGGMGSKMTWEVTGVACFENSIWAARVSPVPPTARYHTDNPVPLVVLAVRKGARPIDAAKIQTWHPVPPEKAFTFETTVGERVLLRIEPDDPSEDQYESLFPSRGGFKRKHENEDGVPVRPRGWNHDNNHGSGHRNDQRPYHHHVSHAGRGGSNQGRFRGGGGGGGGPPSNRGFRGGQRGGGGGGGGGGPGRGGRGGRGGGGGGHHYRSLDDVGTRDNLGGFAQQVTYEDDSERRQEPTQSLSQRHQQPPPSQKTGAYPYPSAYQHIHQQ
ncbi:hypothetical protein VTK73DRAFT_2636 [Phialemonium thermophilum]|uniref:Swiss Army Knife RNA repair protein HAD domain-containing protein n=1 Tax=Phialemonium thermophilum TaxID=223376 RepID=A0ABR3VQH0_9PEZI